MANYNGARRKTTVGNRNNKSQLPETGSRSRNNYTQNSGSDGWNNAVRRPSRSTSDDGWGDISRRPLRSTSNDGWGDVDHKPSSYTSDDLWGPLPSQTTVTENAWANRGSKKNQKSYANQGKKTVPLVGPNFSWNDEDYPALESTRPVENVWEKRKERLESRIAMEPTNMTEEELMIQKAIELSKREAREEEERKRQIEEEYKLQNLMLATNPDFFSDFLTPDELAEANKCLEPNATEYQSNDIENGYEEKKSIWDYPEPTGNKLPQEQCKKPGKKKKRNKSQSSAQTEEKTVAENAWSEYQNFDHVKKNETMLSELGEHIQNPANRNDYNKAEKNDSQFVNEDSDYHPTELTSSLPVADSESKFRKDSQPKISKVIERFGGWGSTNTQSSSLKSSEKQEKYASSVSNNEDNWGQADSSVYSVSNNENNWDQADSAEYSVSNNENNWDQADTSVYQASYNENNWDQVDSSAYSVSNKEDNWRKPHEISKLDKSLQFSKNSLKPRDTCSVESKSSPNEDSWNNKYSSNDKQFNNELKQSVESNAATNFSESDESVWSKKSVPKDEDIMNRIVQDYANLAVNCTDSYSKENVPIQRKSKDIFTNVAPLLNEENPEPNISGFQFSSGGDSQNFSVPIVHQTSKSEITYSLNNTASTEFSSQIPIANVSESWGNSNAGLPTNPEKNEVNNSLYLSPINEAVQNVPNDHDGYYTDRTNPVDSAIPAPIQCETSFQPNPVAGNLMDPSFMMGLNPFMMQQMVMLNNPFFLQQLHQMQMYYRAMSMPFNSPLIPTMPMAPLNPVLNTMGSFFNGDPNSNMCPIPEQRVENNPSTPLPGYNFENENQEVLPPKSDSPKTSAVPNIAFENSWLSDLLSEGAAHMDDTFIPPPTMPVTNPVNSLPAENEINPNMAQDSLHSTYQNESIPQNSNCDTRNLEQDSSAFNNGKSEDTNANTRNDMLNSCVTDVVEASGWGDINDVPKKTYSSWNEDLDGWGDENVVTSKSMINSSRYTSRKQATTRQPIRQPRQTSQW